MDWDEALEKEIDAYVIDGPAIHREGYQAGRNGKPASTSPHCVGDWRDEVWCDGWRLGALETRASMPNESPSIMHLFNFDASA